MTRFSWKLAGDSGKKLGATDSAEGAKTGPQFTGHLRICEAISIKNETYS